MEVAPRATRHHVEAYARSTTALREFNWIFAAAVLTPDASLKNDAAILLLTHVVVALGSVLSRNDEVAKRSPSGVTGSRVEPPWSFRTP